MRDLAPHIVQYQGSKRKLAGHILPYFPRHFGRLIEPFAGMGAITIAAAVEKRAESYVINDLNAPLSALLESAVESPGELSAAYDVLWREQFDYPTGSVDHFFHVRDLFNAGRRDPEKMLYLLARCVKGAVRYNREGAFNQSPDRRRHGTNPQKIAVSTAAVSALLRGKTTFHATDYREILETAQRGDVIYMDPPYQGVSTTKDSRYLSGIDFDEFVEAIDFLNRKEVDFIISYDGRCGEKTFGRELPQSLGCEKHLICAGLSSQSVLLGRRDLSYEALYVSRGLTAEEKKRQHPFSPLETVAV